MNAQIHHVTWVDSGREPKCPANPAYPDGIALDASNGSPMCCMIEFPYPASRCGMYHVRCSACGIKAMVSTAGRPDDPRSILVSCRLFSKD